MKDTTALRLYFAQSARAKPSRLWHHLSAPALSRHLMQAAQQSGIHQALLYPIQAGYLPGKKLSHHHVEITSLNHPLCIELVDSEGRLRKFLRDHAEELHHVHAVLFQCELPLRPRA